MSPQSLSLRYSDASKAWRMPFSLLVVTLRPLNPTPHQLAWFHGEKLIQEPCRLTWDESTAPLTLTIRSNAPVETLDVSRDVQSITYSDPDELTAQQLPLVQLTIQTGGAEQTWILRFDSHHREWSATRYRSFVQWFIARGKGNVSKCRPLVTETIWDTANV
ncbi:hypothetical protein FB45DRAFT_1020785 [Roridomyces roridus]|uniref:Uncharacterized protein n=1 Tax=Roridomyces roridus TaxID=1738132 RepID=A0AAD7FXS5_9AGAR|nr:hypothetical protein FB45DRAFT_1020785 [Roridomyces roridus]